MISAKTRDRIIGHEGYGNRLYRDTSEHPGFEGKPGKITIGIGYNIDDLGLPRDIILELFDRSVSESEHDLFQYLPWTDRLDDARREVLVEMVFNMGIDKVLTFKATLAALQEEQYEAASGHMLDSLWAKQVGSRAKTLSEIIRTGNT